jgi:sec-independent protein translocase protein TatA
MPMGIGLPELMIVLVIALIVLGPKKLPDAGKSLGHGLRGFKDALSGGDRDDSSREADRLEAQRLGA